MIGLGACLCLAVAAVLLWPLAPRVARPARRAGSGRPGLVGPASSAGSRRRPFAARGTRSGAAGRSRARSRAWEEGLAELLGLVLGPLQSGAPPAVALAAAQAAQGRGPFVELVDDLVTAGTHGEVLAPVWQSWAELLDSDDLRFVARAWGLSEQTGSPLSEALATSLEVLRARRRAADRVASAAAGPRASMMVLLLLPLSGPFVGLACGIDPRTLYLSSPAAGGSLVAGLVLAAVARWWSARILARAA